MTLLRYSSLTAATVLVLAACGEGPKEGGSSPSATTQAGAVASGPVTPDAGGKIITVEMETQPDGSNIYEPAHVEAKRGDVIRYMLVTGVHNAHFVADSNAGKTGLPPTPQLLQLPGQTYDFKVDLAPGTYYFHCDPHALLGMIGHLTVTP